MKLLLDENLSDRIVPRIIDLFPESVHVKSLGFVHADDDVIWDYAGAQGFAIVSKDADFHQRSLVFGHPPKLIYVRAGNVPTRRIVDILRSRFDQIVAFDADAAASILILWEPAA